MHAAGGYTTSGMRLYVVYIVGLMAPIIPAGWRGGQRYLYLSAQEVLDLIPGRLFM